MDAALFAKMLSDESILDLKKLGCKYPQVDMKEFSALLREGFYQFLPLSDRSGNPIAYLDSVCRLHLSAVKLLLTPRHGPAAYGLKAMEEEILSTFRIEQIDTSRESVRRVLAGYAPANESENRISGMKKGLEFIADPANTISEANFYRLYQIAIADFLPEESRLPSGAFYRNDAVYLVGSKLEHTGLSWKKLPGYMAALFAFAEQESGMNDLLKAAALHFYIAYLHPYFDGNGRMARLLHLWYLVQQGYSSALFVPLSKHIERSRSRYYRAFSVAEGNLAATGVLDITPFLVYFIEEVYHKLQKELPAPQTTDAFQSALARGIVTEKEKDLWRFALSAYGTGEFSTKQLEKDFGNAAYATIRSFVLKFEREGLLTAVHYGSRVKYRAAGEQADI